MITANRRQLLAGTGLVALTSAAPGLARTQAAATKPDLFIGTGGHGHTFPGASLPFGMVQLSPDTDNSRWDACSGYHRTDTSIMGFSHTHLSGTGIGRVGRSSSIQASSTTPRRAIASVSRRSMPSPAITG
jgi:putative alpha-1,2-mannosidase